ncbi:MAG: GspE/PulE family protein [Alphaproteobacteria bacterium]|nr:GspE/PulE family protein [Alphaproteobacteria bacterium]
MNKPIARKSLAEALDASGRLNKEQLERAQAMAEETNQGLGIVITQLGLLSEKALAQLYGEITGKETVTPQEYPRKPLLTNRITPGFLRRTHMIPIRQEKDQLVVAVVDPLDADAIHALEFSTGFQILARPALLSDLESALATLYPEDLPKTAKQGQGATDKNDIMRLKDMASGAPVIRYVDRLIAESIASRASDIHMESTETGLRVRFRIDGLLRDQESPPAAWRAAVISRVKIIAGLNIAEHRLAQDGRIRMTVKGIEIDIRVATTPTIHGESLTLRILDRAQISLDFSQLGFDKETLDPYLKVLSNPSGMVLVTGPTGSGKTTTLYTSLKYLNSAEVKILTIEDPVEYILQGVNQVQIKPTIGLTFASALRSFLRLDPDILLVGEIRDLETAEIATQAALTGHLVLSTLHTNNAASGVTRLLDMGVPEYLVTSTVTAIVGQRLIRNLCPKCRKEYAASSEILRSPGNRKEITLWRACGCEDCNYTGYRGRSVIFELLPVTSSIRSLILKRAEAEEISAAAKKEGMRTMFEHGVAKALSGQTSMEEVLRVIGGA